MASDVLTLFNMPSSREVGQAYMNEGMISPAQLGSQGLLQQAVSLQGNRGAMAGYGVGRLLGGQAPQEARARGIEEAMAKVQGMGLKDDAEMYSALAQELGARGLSQDAMQAAQAARKVQAEQSKTALEGSRAAEAEARARKLDREENKPVPAQSTVGKLQADRAAAQAAGASPAVLAQYDDAIKKAGQGPVTNIITNQAKTINANKAALYKDIEEQAMTASDRLSMAQSLRKMAPTAFTGIAPDAKLTGARIAQAFGINIKGGSESEVLDQILGQMTIGAAGQLKGSLSDKDREFVKQTVGSRGLTLNTLMYVADQLENRAVLDRKLNNNINSYDVSGKNLNDLNIAGEKDKTSKYVSSNLKEYKELLKKRDAGTATAADVKRAISIRDDLGLGD